MNLYTVLPDLPSNEFSNILPSLERSQVSVSDLLTLEASDVAKRAQIPTREVQRLKTAVLSGLHAQYGLAAGSEPATQKAPLVESGDDLVKRWRTISTLDERLDAALGGGIPLGYLTEITGESGAGKTQLLLTLLLSVQLPPAPSTPQGLARNALYITTEAPLATSRLSQIIANHPLLTALPPQDRPSLARILSISTPDLESQDHILHYQVPVAIKRHNIGLIVIDSITANYRAEFDRNGRVNTSSSTGNTSAASGQKAKDRSGAASMARRTAQLTELGSFLRELARKENLAVVVANQVADRFVPDERAVSFGQQQQQGRTPSSSHPISRRDAVSTATANAGMSGALSQPHVPVPGMISTPGNQNYDPLTLNHQHNFFTGRGDEPPHLHHFSNQNMKTPSLGLVWSNQIAARIALVKSPARGVAAAGGARWQRRMKVVFAPWVGPSEGRGVEFELGRGGVRAVVKEEGRKGGEEERGRRAREGGVGASMG